jgi:hypothetical protein
VDDRQADGRLPSKELETRAHPTNAKRCGLISAGIPLKTVLTIAHRGHWLADSPPYAYQPNQG